MKYKKTLKEIGKLWDALVEAGYGGNINVFDYTAKVKGYSIKVQFQFHYGALIYHKFIITNEFGLEYIADSAMDALRCAEVNHIGGIT